MHQADMPSYPDQRPTGLALSPLEQPESGCADADSNPSSTVSRWFEFVLFTFLAGLLVTELVPGVEVYNRLLGMVLVLLAVASFLRRRGRLATEVLLAGAFIAWGAVTGMLVAVDQHAMLLYVRLLVQELALFFAITEYVMARRSARGVFIFLSLLPFALAAYARSTGQWQIAAGGEQVQMSSLVSNPNSVGILSLYGLFGVAYISRRERDMRPVILPLLFVPLVLAVVVLSASRKSLLTITLFSALWAYLTVQVGRATGRRMRAVFLGVAMLISSYYVWTAVVLQSYVGTRLRPAFHNPRIDNQRYGLYIEGWGFLMANPVTGIGLGNFARASALKVYAHSDYMEPLATTGVVGFILYMSILLCLLWRLIRIWRTQSDPNTRYRAGLYIAILATLMALGLGVPNLLNPYYWVILGAAVGHSCVLEATETRAQYA
ncbi:MAG: O-antigen ligase family protein [candidate division WOR-3 bacterium]|nr:O-antigen ligase family protein [candidate division WOR-3 bacterium]